MSASEADSYLIDAIQRGDQQAWMEVIDRYQGRLVSFARRMLAQKSEAEDLVQETFLGFLRSLPNFDSARSIETYLFAILRNKLSDHFRKHKPGQRQSLDTLEVDDAPDQWLSTETPSRYVAGREDVESQRAALVKGLRAYVEQCCAQSRFDELIVIEMLMVLGMRNKEVAADLDLAETAVAGIKFRVLERWRKLAADAHRHDWQEGDLARDSTIAKIWREEGVSCVKRSTLGRYLLGTLEADWHSFIEFHVDVAGCPRCQANLEDLQREDEDADDPADTFRERCFTSSIGFLSRTPEA